MAKRRATTELNRDNWDKEDEKEDPGTFKRLNEEELKNRIIKKAKRSLGNKETSGISPFAAFSGFSKSSSGNPFNFLKTDVQEGDSSSVTISKMEVTKEENGGARENEEGKSSQLKVTDAKLAPDSSSSEKRKPIRSIEYYRQLQSLNESVMKWMQFHLSKNSCCDFTPVFTDYRKHLETLNFTYPIKSNDVAKEKNNSLQAPASTKDSMPKNANNSNNNVCNFGNNSKSNDDETDYGAHFKSNTTNTSTFSFGIKKTPTATSTMSSGHPTTSLRDESDVEKKPLQFSSGSNAKEESTSENNTFQFSFGINSNQGNPNDSSFSKPFSFAASSVEKTAESESAEAEDPEYVPPRNDFTAVKEEDAFYSKRCKLFFKKDDAYVERGIGTLHLKPLDGKTQLLIRADTSLGNILLNIILSDSLPVSRTGKNNVLLMCVPNPPIDLKKTDSKEAIPMLIRVKTSEDADELHDTLNKHKS